MSVQRDGSRPVDLDKLESALLDAQGDALLLDLAIDHLGQGDSWSFVERQPMEGYKLFILTNEQVRALHHAGRRLLDSVDDAAVAFWGKDVARSASAGTVATSLLARFGKLAGSTMRLSITTRFTSDFSSSANVS